MNNFFPMWSGMQYLNDQYFSMLDGSIQVGFKATQIYLDAVNEFYTSPQTLIKRNLSYMQEVTSPPEPKWQTPHREIALPAQFAKIIRLLDFSQTANPDIIPTLVLPPQAGHHSYIADYSPEQSQNQTLRQNGLDMVYCIEWVGATPATSHTSIEDYIAAVYYCIAQIGGKANLVGDCQGGWLATIYAALYPETVNALVVAGAPVDFQAGDGPIKEAVNYNSKIYPDAGMVFYRGLVQMGGGMLNGQFLLTGFNTMRPSQLPMRYLDLYSNIDNPAAYKRYREMKNWYDFTQNISGDFYLWLVQHLFRDNELILGKLKVGGETVNLKRITCPLFLLAGTRDHITPPPQVFNMADYVATPPEQIQRYLVDAGHIGLFMSHEVLHTTWVDISQKLTKLSAK